MADSLDDAEFWLPPQFLTDEDFLLDGKAFAPRTTVSVDDVAPGRVGYGSGSGLSSPVDSLLGSLESESDEEDLVADLTRKMAHSSLDESFNTVDSKIDSKVRFLSGSPQSTLFPGWDAAALCEAAGEVARLRLTQQLYALSRSRTSGEAMYGAGARRSQAPGPVKTGNSDGVFNPHLHNSQSLSYHRLVADQIQQLKQQQAMLKQQQRAGTNWGMNTKPTSGPYNAAQTCRRKVGSAVRPLAAMSPAAWPPLQQQQQQRTGMRAVFLGAPPSSKRECAGTGVFLPRRAGSQPEPRKKPACATVLLPDKVVRALNLNLENVGPQPHLAQHLNGSPAPENGCVWNLRRSRGAAAQQQQQLWAGRPQPAATHHEIRLPQEWTY